MTVCQVVAAVVCSRTRGYPPTSSLGSIEISSEVFHTPRYYFHYNVLDDDSGTDFSHQETREGHYTHGSYTVLLPDGRLQKVTYYVNGDSGFVAEVTYEGVARYPESEEYERSPPRRSKFPKADSGESFWTQWSPKPRI
ncbi:cuticle protein 21-like [Cherax quadricarinatus]|uniref:cuticle protein 21-like n=1 Tax=Cherax quadricarinatus TaxID=27406 RepID=UPI002379588E|nr:cuticle protein 21-like [Cherax quadricarinatus]